MTGSSIFTLQIALFTYVLKQRHLFEQNPWRCLYLIPSEIIVFINFYSFSIFAVLTNSYFTFFVMTFETVYIRLHQLQSILKRKSKQKFLYFRKFYIKSIVHLSKSNNVFGNIFLVNLLINLPDNCITCLLIVFSVSNVFNIVLYILAICQIILIGFLHIIVVGSNTAQKKLCKQMMKMHVGHHDTVIRSIKLNLFVQDFYSKKNYGFTYGHFGLISMMAFTKVSFSFIK